MYYDDVVLIMIETGCAVCIWPAAVRIPACIKSGVSGWAKTGRDTTPFNNYLKDTSSILCVLYCDNMSDMLMILYNGPDLGAAGRWKASKSSLFAYYRDCAHTYVICMHGSWKCRTI